MEIESIVKNGVLDEVQVQGNDLEKEKSTGNDSSETIPKPHELSAEAQREESIPTPDERSAEAQIEESIPTPDERRAEEPREESTEIEQSDPSSKQKQIPPEFPATKSSGPETNGNSYDADTDADTDDDSESSADATNKETNEKNFLYCDVAFCNYKSNRSSNLLRHNLKIHNPSPKPLTCCKIKFETKFEFEHHRRQVHIKNDSVEFGCDECGKKFKKLTLLNRHDFVHNPKNELQCVNCTYKTDHVHNMVRHCNSRNHECLHERIVRLKQKASTTEQTPKREKVVGQDLNEPSTSGEISGVKRKRLLLDTPPESDESFEDSVDSSISGSGKKRFRPHNFPFIGDVDELDNSNREMLCSDCHFTSYVLSDTLRHCRESNHYCNDERLCFPNLKRVTPARKSSRTKKAQRLRIPPSNLERETPTEKVEPSPVSANSTKFQCEPPTPGTNSKGELRCENCGFESDYIRMLRHCRSQNHFCSSVKLKSFELKQPTQKSEENVPPTSVGTAAQEPSEGTKRSESLVEAVGINTVAHYSINNDEPLDLSCKKG